MCLCAASARNNPSEPRNKHLPFKLQPLPRSVAAELPELSKELLHEDFDGLLLTVHSKELRPEGLAKTPVGLRCTDLSITCGIGSGAFWTDFRICFPYRFCFISSPFLLSFFYPFVLLQVRSAIGLSKVFAGCVIESLASNERQLRALWVNHRLSARSTKLLLQVLLPRAVVEAFALEGFTYTPAAMLQQQHQQQQPRVQSFKSVFIDRRDLDIWPRQCWMLLPAVKNVRSTNYELTILVV